MTNPTSNFGWQMPTSTDLVTDLPADFEVFGQAVDTSLADLKGGTTGQVLKKNTNADMDFVWSADSAGMTNPMTTTGDTIYSSSGSTPARLGIGSTGQVLTVAAGVPSWAAAPTASANWTLLNTGGTALTGAATVTVSGISGADKIMVLVSGASSNTVGTEIGLRLNADTGNNYRQFGGRVIAYSPPTAGSFTTYNITSGSNINMGVMSGDAGSTVSGYALFSGCNTSGVKIYNQAGGGTPNGNNDQHHYYTGGFYNSSSAITSISIVSIFAGNLDAGTVFVYTSA